MQTLTYRADIDGLRAVAVLAVIFYHANATWLPGGFIGVDIFFVISGFLITKIINTEILEQRFSFKAFYIRRIKRILPVFFAVIIATLCVGFFLLSAQEYVDLAKSARFAIGFLANYHFGQEQDYFAPAAEEMPLLHMWSLAVEEQYYFLWPSLLLFFHKKLPRQILSITIILAISSFLLASFLAHQPSTTSLAYYSLPSRLGELMIGSILALYNRHCINPLIANISAILGVFCIGLSFILLNKHSIFPGYNALWPCIGTALIIFSGSCAKQTFINRILSTPFLVFIGLLSYSLYVWHWPILAFTRYYFSTSELSLTTIFLCLTLTFVISYFSWRYIEKPIRSIKFSFSSALKKVFFLPAITLITCCILIKISDGYLWKDGSSRELDTIDSASLVCHNDFKINCRAGDKNQPLNTIIVGDSHTAHLTTFFDILGKKQQWTADILSVDSCPPFTATDINTLPNSKQRLRCKNLINYIGNNLSHYSNIFYALRWDLHFGIIQTNNYHPSNDVKNNLIADIAHLLSQNKKVFLVSQIPSHEYSVSRLFRTTKAENPLNNSYLEANAILQNIASQYDNVYYIDTATITETWKNGIINELPTYKDNNHLNVYGQKMLAENNAAFNWLGQILK